MKHLGALMKIELTLTKRQAAYFLLSVGMPTAFYLFFSGFVTDQAPQNFARDYMMSMTAFSMMSTALFSLPTILHTDKVNNWQKVLRHSPVSMVEYYVSKFLSIVLDYLVSIVVVFSVGHFVRHVEMPVLDWLVAAVLLIIGSAAFVAIGLTLTLLPSMQLSSVVGNILYLGLAVLGGLWMPLSMFPDWMQSIGKCLPTYQLMELIKDFLNDGSFNLGATAYLLVFTVILLRLTVKVRKRIEVH